ncbi:hypothetical protein ACFVMC_17125 [Nocardia sp. NPDC127579]|uniref:hypothetical protein n=1 Tax=Nocardia sp. NPDC127579 TaxID=3345402 RepID=UPI00362C692D
MTTENDLKTWQTLKQNAVSGEFKMDTEIGSALANRCQTLLEELADMKSKVSSLGHLSGYGTLPSAIALQEKFQHKATGGGTDANDNAVKRLEQHIEVVTLMRDTYRAAIGKLEQADTDAANPLKNQTEQVK